MTTTINNPFTKYTATITTKGIPSVSTVRRHLARSKAKGCASITYIWIDGTGYDLIDGALVRNGLYSDHA